MFHNIRTFQRQRFSFAEALEFHQQVVEVCKQVMKTRFAKLKTPNQSAHLVELWEALQGIPDITGCQTKIPQCVDATIPPEYVPVIRGLGGVVAAFAFCELAKALTRVNDLDDDFEIRMAFVEGWAEFEQRRQQANLIQEGMGCDKSQSWLTLRDIEDKSGHGGLLKQILAISNLAGRMYEKFGYQRKDHPNDDPEEVKGAKLGGDIDRVLPTELAMLGDEELADMQAMKLLTDNAPVLEMEGRESKCRGPLVLCIDESGSMSDSHAAPAYHGRNTWAKAAAVALTRIAWQENRPVKVCHFGSGSEAQDVPKDDHRALFEMARSFLSGGTCFSVAFKRGRQLVGDLEAEGFKGADIVMITDGEDDDYDDYDKQIDEMHASGIKLWTVAIGEDIDRENPVRKRCERYTFAADSKLGNPNAASDLAQGLNQAAMGNEPDWGLN
jgi:hypothetical protein